ncbi:MAG: flagellar hook-length control protein FliK [Sulfurospirillum cavolei]|nr:flagellar hook-length control protein FliK [Sulfurospirillum cavolei]
MQDLFSFVQTKSNPLAITPVSVVTDISDTQTNAQEGTFTESFFAMILGKMAQETDIQTDKELPTATTTSSNSEDLLTTAPTTEEAKSIDEHLLEDLLSVVNALQEDSQITTFPTLNASSNLEKILSSETARQDFANVKNVSDLLDLSKKYDLGLEKLSISKESVESLQTKFPTLTQNNFFDDITTALNQIQTDVETTTQTTTVPTQIGLMSLLENQQSKTQTTTSATSILSELIAKEGSTETKNTQQTVQTDSSASTEETPIVNEKQQTQTAEILPSYVEEESSIQTLVKPLETVIQKVLHESNKQESKKSETQTTSSLSTDTNSKEVSIVSTDSTDDANAQTSKESTNDDELLAKPLKQEKIDDTASDEITVQTLKPILQEETNLTSEEIQTTTDIKTDNTIKTTAKQDFSTNKSTSSKESLSQFASDLKEQIESYKPPIMKVELSLSPKNLGDVDVTLLTRGNNLHVNISSNTTTMNLFTQNQDEVKSALVNMGFTNLEMNFSDQRNSEQSQQRQKQSSGNFDEFTAEQTEEDTTLLEIVIPQYV